MNGLEGDRETAHQERAPEPGAFAHKKTHRVYPLVSQVEIALRRKGYHKSPELVNYCFLTVFSTILLLRVRAQHYPDTGSPDE